MADGTLPRYFEREKQKGARQGGTLGYSSAPSGDMGGGAASSGPAPAPSGPKTSASTGGSGFVNFGQYFGANAPAVQQQAQKAVEKAKGTSQMSLNAPAGASGLGSFRTASFGPMPSAQTMMQRQTDPLSARLAQAQRQSTALNTAARSGDMGAGVSAFDQMLGGGLTQRAARQEQQRLGSLRGYLEAEQAQLAQEAASRQQQEQAQYDADRQREEADWYARQEEERRYYEQLRAQEQAAMDEEMAGQDAYLDQIPDEY